MKKDLNENFQKIQLITNKEILSFKEALLYLNISASNLYKKTSTRTINFYKPNNGKIYFCKSDLDNWMLSNKQKTKEESEQEIINYLKS